MKHSLGTALILIALLAAIFFGPHLLSTSVDQRVNSTRDAFVSVLQVQPQISVNQTVVLPQKANGPEMPVLNRDQLIFSTEHLQPDTLSLQLPKTTTATAKFRIVAGFDLTQPFSVSVDPVTHNVNAVLPHAKILSVEQMGDFNLHGENSLPVDSSEKTQITDDLKASAYDASKTIGLKEAVEKQVTQRLNDLLGQNGQTIEVSFQ